MNQSANTPALFISHKHVDSRIADIIRSFITMQSGGRVHVHQSSSPWADAPKVGRNLNKQLIQTLWRTSVVIIIYTTPEQDWSYCMWECGVALHPQSPHTKIILFQCADSAPTLFAEQVNVDVRTLVDVQKFTNEFLTSPEFFPEAREPITRFLPNGQEVASAAADFFEKLKPALPPPREEPSIEWPAYPFLQLELAFQHTHQLRDLPHETRVQLVHNETLIAGADMYGAQLFGMPSFPPDMTFKQLTDNWTVKHLESNQKWVESIIIQVVAGAMWEFPPAIWEEVAGINRSQCYVPILTRVRKLPVRQCMQFDIYFYKSPSVALMKP